VVLTRGAVVDWPTALIAAGSLVVVWRSKNKEPFLVVAAGVVGVVLYPLVH
jgi:chromate transporter